MNITSGSPLWRIVRVAPTSAPTGVRTLAARGTSAPEAKVLTTGPPVVPYASVIGAGLSSTLEFFWSWSRKFYKMGGSGNYAFNLAGEFRHFVKNANQ